MLSCKTWKIFNNTLFSQNFTGGCFCNFLKIFLLDQIPLKVRVSCWSSKNFAIDLQLWQKRLWYSCFPVIFAKFFRAPVLKNTLGRQLLKFFHNSFFLLNNFNPAKIYLLRNIKKSCKICSKLTIKTPERYHWDRSGVFNINFWHISQLFPVFLLSTLTKKC